LDLQAISSSPLFSNVFSDCTDLQNQSIVLKLQPHTALSEDQLNAAELARLLNETKKLICHACQAQNSRTIHHLLSTPASPGENEIYAKNSEGGKFEEDKKIIQNNLDTLIAGDILDCHDDIIKMISKDIKEQHRLRARRKQELEKLQNTQKRLVTKGWSSK